MMSADAIVFCYFYLMMVVLIFAVGSALRSDLDTRSKGAKLQLAAPIWPIAAVCLLIYGLFWGICQIPSTIKIAFGR